MWIGLNIVYINKKFCYEKHQETTDLPSEPCQRGLTLGKSFVKPVYGIIFEKNSEL